MKQYYKLREIAAILDISEATLRWWEKNLENFNPNKTKSGRRRYTQTDVEICQLIKKLREDKGMTLKYIDKELRKYRKYSPRNYYTCLSTDKAIKLLDDAKGYCENDHAIDRIESVKQWLIYNR